MVISRRKFLTYATKSFALGAIGGKDILFYVNKNVHQNVSTSSKSKAVGMPEFEKWMLSTVSKNMTS